jgi:NAD dependent epimerase/dehydratase family
LLQENGKAGISIPLRPKPIILQMPNVIITGSTGMVGKGVLLECLENPLIEKVLLVNRNHLEINHPKLGEVLLPDFTRVNELKNRLSGYDACFHCMGVSSIGMNEETFLQLTFHITKAFVDVLYELNPNMVFNYVSGTGTDSTEKGKIMWARVKGKTENLILNKGFKDAYAFRPGLIIPEKGIQSRTGWYNAIYVVMRPFFSLLKKSKNITTTTKLGMAMINSLKFPQAKKFLENKDINEIAEK